MHTLTAQREDDPPRVASLLAQIPGEIGRFIADSACEGAPTWRMVSQHSASARIVIPTCSTAVRSCGTDPPTLCERHLEAIVAHTGYGPGHWLKRRRAAIGH